MKNDQVPDAVDGENDRRRIADLRIVERSPILTTRRLVEADDERVLAADEHDQLVAVEKRRSDHSPDRQLRIEVLDEIFRPKLLARLRVEAEHLPHRSDRVDAPLMDLRSGARAGGITDRVPRRAILMNPQNLSRRGVEAQHAFILFLMLPIRDVHAAFGDGGPRIALGDRRRPDPRQEPVLLAG